MKFVKSWIFIFIVFTSINTFGQVNKQDGNSFWREYIVEIMPKINLEDVTLSSKENHLRIWTGNPIIEVWKVGNNAKGQITYWVKEVVPSKEEDTNRYYSTKDYLDSNQCNKIMNIASKYSIYTLPSDDGISNWMHGLDGITYFIETKQNNTYRLKTYWTPTAQDGVKEAEVVQSFIDDVLQAVDAENRMNYFQIGNPFYSWTNNGASVISRILPYDRYWKMKRERNRYRKQKEELQKAK